MDPMSATVKALSLVSRSITIIQACQRYASKYQDAELSMTSLRTECSAINLALSQIKRLIIRDQRRNLRDRFEDYVLVEYESVLTGCQLVFTTFNARISELGLDNENNLKEATFWEKVKYVWNEPQMELLRGGISGQANAVGILLSVFQAESSDKAYSLMRNNRAKTSFRRVANDTASLIRSLSASNDSSRDGGTYEGTTESLLGDEDFSFDNIVLNSTVYRRAFVRQQSKKQLRESNDDTMMTSDATKRELSIIPDDNGGNKPAEETRRLEDKSDALGQSKLPSRLAAPIYKRFMTRPSFLTTTLENSKPEEILADKPKANLGAAIVTKPPEVAASSSISPLSKTELTSQDGIGSTSSKVLQTNTAQSSGIDMTVTSPEMAHAGSKSDDAHGTHSQINTGQSEQLPFFKDYYSEGYIHSGDKVSTVWAYSHRAADEFDLERGDVLKVVGIWDDGWATGVLVKERAHEWDAQKEGQAKDSTTVVDSEVKAFPLVCVCIPDHWRSIIEGDKPSETDSDAAQQGVESKSTPDSATKATPEVRALKSSSGQDEKEHIQKASFRRRLLKVLLDR